MRSQLKAGVQGQWGYKRKASFEPNRDLRLGNRGQVLRLGARSPLASAPVAAGCAQPSAARSPATAAEKLPIHLLDDELVAAARRMARQGRLGRRDVERVGIHLRDLDYTGRRAGPSAPASTPRSATRGMQRLESGRRASNPRPSACE